MGLLRGVLTQQCAKPLGCDEHGPLLVTDEADDHERAERRVQTEPAEAKEIRVGMNSFEEKEKLIGYVINRDTGGYISQSGYGYGRYGKYQKYRKYAELDEETMNTEDTL